MENNLIKKCPTCDKNIIFSNKYKLKRSFENNSNCSSCAKKGNKNPMYQLTGNTNPSYGFKRDIKLKEKHSLFMKNYCKENPRVFSDETKDKIRIGKLKWLEKNGKIIKPFYNKNACYFMDTIENFNFKHALNGGEILIKEFGYYVDGYDEIKNVVFEYDERFHFDIYGNLKEKDMNRMLKIQSVLKCDFLRYNELKKELIWYHY